MFENFKKKEKTEQEAIQDILDKIYELEDAFYSEEIAQIDKEKATTFKNLYLASLDMCKGNREKEKAYLDVIMACELLERYPSAKNSRVLDEKLDIAGRYD